MTFFTISPITTQSLVEEGWGEGEEAMATLTLILPHQGGG